MAGTDCPWCGEPREVCRRGDEGCPPWDEPQEDALKCAEDQDVAAQDPAL